MADRYWVGGAGTWNTSDTTHWSTTDGGSSGASVPTATQSVAFTANSGSGEVSLQVPSGGTLNCSSISFVGYTGSISGLPTAASSILTVYGDFILSTSMTWIRASTSYTIVRFSTGADPTINRKIKFAGQHISQCNFQNSGIWTLQDDMNVDNLFQMSYGYLNISSNTITTPRINFASPAPDVTAIYSTSTGKIVLTGEDATVWNCPFGTSLLRTTSIVLPVYLTASAGALSGTRYIKHGSSATAITVSSSLVRFYVTNGADTVSCVGTVFGLDYSGFSGTMASVPAQNTWINGDLTLSSSMSVESGANPLTFISNSHIINYYANFDTPVSINCPVYVTGLISSSSNGLRIWGDLTATNGVILTRGLLDIGNYTLTANTFESNNTNTRVINADNNGKIVVTGANTTVFNMTQAIGYAASGSPLKVYATNSSTTGTRNLYFAGSNGGTESNVPSFYITAGSDSIGGLAKVMNLDFNGFSGTLNATDRLVYGSLRLSSGMALTASATQGFNFARTVTTTSTITSSGILLDMPVRFTLGATVGYALGDDLTMGTASTLTLNSGVLDITNKVVTVGAFSSNNTSTRKIVFGSSGKFVLTSGTAVAPNPIVWNVVTTTGYTIDGTSRIDTTSTGNRIIAGGKGENVYVFGSGELGLDGAIITDLSTDNTPKYRGSLNIMSNSSIYGNLLLSNKTTTVTTSNKLSFLQAGSTMGITSNGVLVNFNIDVNSVGGGVDLFDSLIMSSSNTMKLVSGSLGIKGNTLEVGYFNSNYSTTRTLAWGTGGTIDITGSNGEVWYVTVSNLTYSGSTNVRLSADTSVGTRTFYNESDVNAARQVNLYITAGSDVVSVPLSIGLRSLDCTGFTGIWDQALNANVRGNITLGAGMTIKGGRGFDITVNSCSLSTNGVKIPGSISVDIGANQFRLVDNLDLTTGTLTITAGNVLNMAASDLRITAGAIYCNQNAARLINLGSSVITLVGSSTVLRLHSSLLVSMSDGTIRLTDTSTSNKVIYAGGNPLGNFELVGEQGSSVLTLYEGASFKSFRSFRQTSHTILFSGGNTYNFRTWGVNGSSSFMVDIASTTSTVFTVNYNGTTYVSSDYLRITNSAATPAAKWFAGTHSVSSGTVTGWVFSPPILFITVSDSQSTTDKLSKLVKKYRADQLTTADSLYKLVKKTAAANSVVMDDRVYKYLIKHTRPDEFVTADIFKKLFTPASRRIGTKFKLFL